MKAPLLTIAFALFQPFTAAAAPEKKTQAGKHRDVYLAETKGLVLTTTDARVKIITKQNIFEMDNNGWVQAELLIATKLDAASTVTLTMHQKEAPTGKLTILANFNLRGSGELKKETHLGFESFPFQIRKDLFSASIVMFHNSTESFQFYLHPKEEGESSSGG